MKIKTISIALALTLGLAACGSKSPENVVRDFYQLTSDGKPAEAVKLIAPEIRNKWGDKINSTAVAASEEMAKCGGIKTMKVTEKPGEGDIKVFSVEIEMHKGGELKKCGPTKEDQKAMKAEDGNWYVDLR